MEKVRSKAGVPVASDFACDTGTAVVVNESNGDVYVLVGTTPTKVGGTTITASQITSGTIDQARLPVMAATALSISADFTVPAGYGVYVPDTLEIAAAATLEIPATSILEVG